MLFNIKDLVKKRPGAQNYELNIQNLRIKEGDKVAITGPSGCGKSTTLDILGLSLHPDQAREFVFSPENSLNNSLDDSINKDYDIIKLWENNKQDILSDLRLAHMGYVLQSGELLPFLTVGENMVFTALLTGMQKQQAKEIALKLAKKLEISELWQAMPATLSVGQRQRVAIGRALASKPSVILADEPTAALDPLHAAKVMDIFLEALEQQGSTLILVTHNIQWAKAGGLKEISFKLCKTGDQVKAILDSDYVKE